MELRSTRGLNLFFKCLFKKLKQVWQNVNYKHTCSLVFISLVSVFVSFNSFQIKVEIFKKLFGRSRGIPQWNVEYNETS